MYLNIASSITVLGISVLTVLNNILINPTQAIFGTSNGVTPTYGLTAAQKLKTEKLVSIFENGTTEIQYGYIENIHDGNGYSAGKIGFVSVNDEIYKVIELYTQKKGTNSLSKYLPRLAQLAENEDGDTSGLSGIESAWRQSANDQLFRLAQDELADAMYFQPAMRYASNEGVKYAITKAFIYDTLVQHGGGNDHDGLKAIIKRVNNKMAGSPKNGISETKWLQAMINERRDVLEYASDPEMREVWAESVERCDVFQQILDNGNLDFFTPITGQIWGDTNFNIS